MSSEFIRGEEKRQKRTLMLSKIFPDEVVFTAARKTINLSIQKSCEDKSYAYFSIIYYDQDTLLDFYRRLGYEENEYLHRLTA